MLDELRRLIVDELNLEDVSPEDIKDDEPLFGGGRVSGRLRLP